MPTKQQRPYWETVRNNNDPMNNYTDAGFWEGLLLALLAWLATFLAPILPFLIFTGALIIADSFTGTIAARKRKEQIHPRGLRRTVEKFALYAIAILLSHGLTVVFVPGFEVAYVAAFVIARAELRSNFLNIREVTGVDLVTWLNKFLKIPGQRKP